MPVEDSIGHLPSCHQESLLNYEKNGSAVGEARGMKKLKEAAH
jgi:hypothetical protein